jgi:hypothetical protein
MLKHEAFKDEVTPAVVDRRTGEKVECACSPTDYLHEACQATPRNHRGEPFTKTTTYEYHRYDMLRICDSGD